MNSIPQQAVTNGYRNIEYLRAQFMTESTVVVMKESPPWRRNSTARVVAMRSASSLEIGLRITLRTLSSCSCSFAGAQFSIALFCDVTPRTDALLQPAAAKQPASAQLSSRSRLRLASAWCVHAFTASGAVCATLALIAIARGRLGQAAVLMLAALAIDSVDGTLARRVGVATWTPRIDGRRLDDVVDFLSYVIVPVFFMVWIGALPAWLVVAPVLASAYGFSQRDAKTPDDFFLGWPSYWNVVAFYVWLLEIGTAWTSGWVLFFSAAVFVPLKYIYPSRLREFRRGTLIGTVIWMLVMTFAALWPEPARAWRLPELSLLFPAWYVALSAWLGRWWERSA